MTEESQEHETPAWAKKCGGCKHCTFTVREKRMLQAFGREARARRELSNAQEGKQPEHGQE